MPGNSVKAYTSQQHQPFSIDSLPSCTRQWETSFFIKIGFPNGQSCFLILCQEDRGEVTLRTMSNPSSCSWQSCSMAAITTDERYSSDAENWSCDRQKFVFATCQRVPQGPTFIPFSPHFLFQKKAPATISGITVRKVQSDQTWKLDGGAVQLVQMFLAL